MNFQLNSAFPLLDKGVSNALSLHNLPRHRWYFVKEGFSPELVSEAIAASGVNGNATIVDPFSGSGTVPLTAALAGLKVTAFEINPFLAFLSRTKLQQTPPRSLINDLEKIIKATQKPTRSPIEGYSTFTKGNRWERWLFPTCVLRACEAGIQRLSDVREANRDLLKLALIGAAMDCCNATRDGKCLRYRGNWQENEATAGDFRARLEIRCKEIAEDLKVAPIENAENAVFQGDCRTLLSRQLKRKSALCVTSPPYLNSFDYSDVYRPELFLGGFVKNNTQLRSIRLSTIRSHVQANWEQPESNEFGPLYSDCVRRIKERSDELWDRRIPTMIQAYFEDMENVLRNLKANSRVRATVWLVVSTSAYAGVEVPVDLILADIGHRVGWQLREIGVLRYLRSSSQYRKYVEGSSGNGIRLRESVVILQ